MSINDINEILFFTCSGICNLSVESINTTSVRLSWSTLRSDNYLYEVGYAIISSDRDCSSIMLDTLPQNYTSFTNTTNGTVQVNDLIADTCYVFGVRVLCLSVTAAPGQWTIQILQTDEGNIINIQPFCMIRFFPDELNTSSNVNASSNVIVTGLIAGLSIAIMIILILVVIILLKRFWISKRYTIFLLMTMIIVCCTVSNISHVNNDIQLNEPEAIYETMDQVYDIPNIKRYCYFLSSIIIIINVQYYCVHE